MKLILLLLVTCVTSNAQSGTIPARETPAGTIDGVNAKFTLKNSPAGSVFVFKNGLLQQSCSSILPCDGDYQISGRAIIFLAAQQTVKGFSTIPNSGDKIQVLYWH